MQGQGQGWRRPGDLGEGALQGSPGTWVQHGKGHSSIRKLLTQRADDLSLITNAQANVFHAKHLMAPALGPGHFHRVASEGKGFSSTPCFLVEHGRRAVSAAHQSAAEIGPPAPAPSPERPLGSPLSLAPLTGAQVTPSLLHCSSVPGTKKEHPLMLKIHFKLLPTSSPREMTKQNQ